LASAQVYIVDFTSYIYAKNNPFPLHYPSFLEGTVNFGFDGTYEITAYFRADSGNAEKYEEFNIFVDGQIVGKTTDPNQGDDYEVQKIGKRDFSKGVHSVKIEHAYNYNDYGYQGVYPLEVSFKLVSKTNVVPAAPSSVWASNITQTTMVWNWTGVSGAHHYEAQYQKYANAVWVNITSGLPAVGCPTCSWTMSGGTPDTAALFRVRACNASGGESGCSNWVQKEARFLAVVPPLNHAPTANAGPDREVFENQSVVLLGSGSDPDGDSLTYFWSCNGGSLSNANVAQPVFYAPEVSTDRTYLCTLRVSDAHNLTASDSVYILVKDTYVPPLNHAPTANAGPDREVFENQSVVLLGSGSDPDGDSLTYFWSCNGGSLSNANVAQPVFYAPEVSTDRTYLCTLRVSDEGALSDSDSLNILVRNNNEEDETVWVETNSPLDIQRNQATLVGTLQNRGDDYVYVYFQWGTSASYGYETEPSLRYSEGSFSQTIYNLTPNTLYHYRAVARNSEGEIAYGEDRRFYTMGDNYGHAPTANAGPDREVWAGESITLYGSGYDPDGYAVTYYWECSGGSVSSAYAANCTYTAPFVEANTYYTCRLTVRDKEGLSDSDETTILVKRKETNRQIYLAVEKTARNMTRGDQNWSTYVAASSSEIILFRIRITSTSNVTLQNVMVKDTLPPQMLYQGNLKIDDISDSRDISVQEINIGSLSPGQTKTITFLAKVGSWENFNYGLNEIINTVLVYNTEIAQTATCRLAVRKTGVAGAFTSSIPTGKADHLLLNSFLLPFLLSLFVVWIFRSELIGFDQFLEERRLKVASYRAEKKLKKKIKKLAGRI